MIWVVETFVFVLGLIFGSFFNVCIYRMPLDSSPLRGRSHCPGCAKPIPWQHNLPVLSYLWLRGRAACCGQRVSIQYPLVEATTGALFLGLYLYFGPGWQWVAYCVLGSWLLILSVIDFHHQIIPDELSLSGIPLGLGAALLTGDISWQSSLAGIFVGGGVFFAIAYLYERITGREGLGGGDIKLLAMLGAWLGVESILIIIVLSTFLGSIVGVSLMVVTRADSKAAIPFGPFLATAAMVYLLLQQPLLAFFYPVFFAP